MIKGKQNAAIGGKGTIRRKYKKKVNSRFRGELLEKIIAPYRPSLIASINTVHLYAHERNQQLQFDMPKMKTLEKCNLAIIYAKGKTATEPPDDEIIDELNDIKEHPDRYFTRQPNKNEKKLRKALLKLEPKEMPQIISMRIHVRNDKFKIKKPEVYKIPNEDIYLVYGIIEMANSNILKVDRDQFQDDLIQAGKETDVEAGTTTETLSEQVSVTPNEVEIDPEHGFSNNDIEIIMGQTQATKAEAIKALKETQGDLINAIMLLTQ